MQARPQHDKHDQSVEDSFPASDPPATSGIVGPKIDHSEGASRPVPHERDEDAGPEEPRHDAPRKR
jgi:hypothetical protein